MLPSSSNSSACMRRVPISTIRKRWFLTIPSFFDRVAIRKQMSPFFNVRACGGTSFFRLVAINSCASTSMSSSWVLDLILVELKSSLGGLGFLSWMSVLSSLTLAFDAVKTTFCSADVMFGMAHCNARVSSVNVWMFSSCTSG